MIAIFSEMWPGRTSLSNTLRSDLLCQGSDEMIVNFAEGSPAWPHLREYGYHLRADDHLNVAFELDNTSDNPYTTATSSLISSSSPSTSCPSALMPSRVV